MTSRELVLKAFDHIETDMIPVDMSGHTSSGISAILYPRLRQYLGLSPKTVYVYDPIQQIALIDNDMLDLFGVDTIESGRGFALDDENWADWVLPDGTPCKMPVWAIPEIFDGSRIIRSASGRIIAKMPENGHFFEQIYYPYYENDTDELSKISGAMNEIMWCALGSPPGPLIHGEDGDTLLREGVRSLRKKTDRAVIGMFGGNLLEMGQFFYRNDNFLMLLALDPKRVHSFLDRITELHLERLEGYLNNVGCNIDIIVFGDDLGMQGGPQISPEMYREFFKPRHKMMWDRVKELSDVKIMLHCCGGVRELLPDLIDAGLDAVNPVQISARGMDAAELKREFGSDLVFWGGGCDTQHILPFGTPGEVRDHVRRQTDILRKGGGFVFQQVHNIMLNVPPENVAAMFEAVNDQ
ncbi:uroporphyrinogen decarboxylase family protein [candidate division KSB1 bacterium]